MARILESAYRHGCDDKQILHAWRNFIAEFKEGDDPKKVIRIGFDGGVRLLEVGGEIFANGDEKIFHAMAARKLYTERIGLRYGF